MNCSDKQIGKRIAGLRKGHFKKTGKRLTQDALANAVGLSRTIIAKIETGVQPLTPQQLANVARFFGVSVDYLVTGVSTENTAIASELGLSQNSIERLKQTMSMAKDGHDEFGRNRLFALNVLLQSPDGEELLDDLFRYMVTDFDHAITFIEHTFDSGESFEIVNRNRPVSKLRFESVMREPQAPINIPVSYLREALLREIEAKLSKLREDVIRQYGVPYEERERPDNPFQETMDNLRKQEG